ncbi:helicase [Nostoc sp. DSM 114167]|jgi:L-rhamnose mutarotase|uniref:helicase n=1 Tax=Nostoc sp. DSM 114167 TaxID=3439050 RepID=UPI004045A280
MELSFLERASIWGQIFEIAVKRGVLQYLIHQNLLLKENHVFQLWQSHKNADVSHQLVKAFKITDPNHKEWVETMLRHLLVLGYGLGWTTMRECLNHSQIRQPKLEAIWCPLTLPSQQMQRDEEKEETAKAFQEAFKLPKLDENLIKRGQPARADFILWLSNESSSHRNTEEIIPSEDSKSAFSQPKDIKRKKIENLILCLEFSYNAPIKFADFKNEAPHTEEISRYARYIESRGVFSRVCAEVEGEEFSLSKRLESFLSAFSGQDKPLFKLCQASSYTDSLIKVLRARKRLEGSCHARAIAVTSNGIESLAAQFWGVEPEPDTRAKLMKSLGQAYCKAKHSNDDVPLDLDAEIGLVFKKLLGGLPSAFKEQAKSLAEKPALGQYSHFLFQENVTDFYNPMGEISKDEAIASIEDHDALHEFFGSDPITEIANFVNKINPDKETIPLRQVHEAAVFAGLSAAQVGKINVLALEGNPGIGKTTAVMKFLKQQSQGFLFFYLSPRVVINRDVTDKLARENEQPTGILTITSNRNLIDAVPEWYKKQVEQNNFPPHSIDSAVVVDGIEKLTRPLGSIFFLTPEQELDIDCNIVGSTRFKRRLNERDYSIESLYSPGVLGTIAKSARKLLEANPQVNQLVMTAAIQGYRTLNDQSTTVNAFNNLFAKKADTKAGKNERSAFAARIPTIVVMVDELAGDGAGAPFVRKVAEWLEQQFIKPFDTNRSPFKIVLILADASLSNEVVLDSFLNSGDRAPDKVLISQSRGEAAFRVTGTCTKIGPRRYPTLHVMTNSYPASKLSIDYSIRLSPIKPGQNSDGTEQTIRQAIREKSEEETLTNAYLEIKDGLHKGAEQLIFFAQDKAFLRQLQEKLTTGKEALLKRGEVEVLDQSVSPDQRLKLVKPPRRDEVRAFLMTSSGARGVSFPKTDCIIAAIPRFNIEAALMEVAQLIYRGRGMYIDSETGMEVSGDNKDRRLVMLINDFIIEREDIDPKRLWLRQSSDLLTLLVMLRSTIHTRIKGDAGLNKNRIAFVPVGSVGDEELLRLMSDDLLDFLREAKIFISDSHPQEAKAIVKKAEQLTANIFKHFDLRGQSLDKNAKSYANYQTLQALVKAVSRIQSSLLPSLSRDALEIPDSLTCIGPFWIEDWSDRQTEEIFSFEAWKADIKQNSSCLLGSLKEIAESKKFKFPSKLKRPANELYKLLSREQEGFVIESSTRQALKTKNIVIGLPLDYPHFWNEQSEDDIRQQVLEDPQAWRSALGRSLTPQGLIIPVVPHYRTFPWVAVAGRRIFTQLETVFSDRYFMASSELNLLNTILLEDEAENK